MKVFEMVLETEEKIFKHVGTYKNRKEAQEMAKCNGAEIIRIKDVTETYKVNLTRLEEILFRNGYGDIETELITFTLQEVKENFHRLPGLGQLTFTE